MMQAKVKLSEIAETMDLQSDDMTAWLNRKTGEIVMFNNEILRAVEDGDDPQEAIDMYGGCEKDIDIAKEIAGGDTWLALPSKFYIHDYSIMEKFCRAQTDSDVRNSLLNAIRGKGAFGRFRAAVEQAGLLDQWYEFRKSAYMEIAREWCGEKGVACE